jgi:hypothetical protein
VREQDTVAASAGMSSSLFFGSLSAWDVKMIGAEDHEGFPKRFRLEKKDMVAAFSIGIPLPDVRRLMKA